MSVDRFDHLARLLAQGTSRRQILKGFAAGLGASLFSTFHLPGVSRHEQIAHAATPVEAGNSEFLPLIIGAGLPPICSLASHCQKNVACSSDQNDECRCIESAEGAILCGEVPPCDAQACESSTDCAKLGKGYFCAAEGGGCCGNQLCIAPCQNEATCPDDRLCGNTCCPPNTFCQDGACVDVITGTWTGTLTYEEQSIGIRFVLTRDFSDVTGRVLLQDPVSMKYLETGLVTGIFDEGRETSVYLESGSFASGNFARNDFTGDFFFADFNDEVGLMTTIALQRP